MQLPNSIFHSYDIRGKYPHELSDHIALLLGKSVGTYVICHIKPHETPSACVGRAPRESGEPLKENFVRGLTSTGCNVIDLGICTTPMINFGGYTFKVSSQISITASHINEDYNGFKISCNLRPFTQHDYQELKKIVEIGKYERGKGQVERKNIESDYLKSIYDSVSVEPDKIAQLSQTLGISQDTDGDRLIVKSVDGDLLSAIFSSSILEKHNGSKIVLNVASSQAVIDYITKHGGKVILSKTGYPNIMAVMEKEGAIFGGEISGHYYFKDKHLGYSDGLYSAARLCEILETKRVTLQQLVRQIPQYFAKDEIRVKLPENKNAHTVVKDIIQSAHNTFSDANFLEIDGARVTFQNKSWFLIRASGTENVISLRIESKTKSGLAGLTKILQKLLKKHGINVIIGVLLAF